MAKKKGIRSVTVGTVRWSAGAEPEFDLVDEGDCLIEFEVLNGDIEAGCIAEDTVCPQGCDLLVAELAIQGFDRAWEIKCTCLGRSPAAFAPTETIVLVENLKNDRYGFDRAFEVTVLQRKKGPKRVLKFKRQSTGEWELMVGGVPVTPIMLKQRSKRERPASHPTFPSYPPNRDPNPPGRTPDKAVHIMLFRIP